MDTLDSIFQSYADYAWGLPLLILLIGGGLYLLVRSHFLPFRYFFHALNVFKKTVFFGSKWEERKIQEFMSENQSTKWE